VTIEKSSQSIFDDKEYEEQVDKEFDLFFRKGFQLVESGSWKSCAPNSAFVYGLKELPEQDDSPLVHKHIMFAHCYKQQAGWKQILSRFIRGQGLLLDLEFLTDAKGRRVAAFGYYAGFAGSAVGIDVWCHRILKDTQVDACMIYKVGMFLILLFLLLITKRI
jgi:saccharopine dehydrogenase (NAD+, L-lysine-forming)